MGVVMRYAIIGDIHGNYYALEAVINYILNDYGSELTGFIFTGDYVGDFVDGSKVVDLIEKLSKEYRTFIIKGNRETDQVGKYIEALNDGKEPNWSLDSTMGAALVSCRELGRDRLNYLKSLPNSCIIYRYAQRPIFVKHKMPLTPSEIERVKKENMVVITGHTHEAHQETKDGITLFNPGSIGIPDDGIVAASYGIMESNDNGDWTFTVHDVKYDIEKSLASLKSNSDLYKRCCGWGKALELSLITGVNCTSLYANEARRIASVYEKAKENGEQVSPKDIYYPTAIYNQNRYSNVNYDGSYLSDIGLQSVGDIEVFGSTDVISVGTNPVKLAQPTEEMYTIALDNVRRLTMLANRKKVFTERHNEVVK